MNIGSIILYLMFGSPVIIIIWLLLKLIIIDPISNKIEDSERKRHINEEIIINITTYQNKNISEVDIIKLFHSQWNKYKSYYYICNHKIYSEKDKQNYAWSLETKKNTYGWGTVYDIDLNFSNGWVCLSFSDSEFSRGNVSSQKYNLYGLEAGSYEIDTILNSCRDEALIMWKLNGMEPNGYLPFKYYFEKDKAKSSFDSNDDQSSASDLIAFYRNMLGLKLCFTHNELKIAYRKAVGKYHPDRYETTSSRDRENAEILMKQINEAYEILGKYVD